ncbi:MAG: DUF3299 domain-containing protein [Owenweeksia sp.]|nr:DUF3299 domain-containing protein [Owenweeksia sp.]MBF97925.1 DUF3299 domain-containing protein [Owenweeksia sp.]HBF19402.1 DUF3299 domain-containing protein [Cryomorphaceae bacterium]HCQ15837.1 DUF3299 domain-containing protein [Cryomorphaceae bacterium]|tara:strand:- start:46 stop:498 length:453 start_codon:yes stop_codon:yes gene_type:complete
MLKLFRNTALILIITTSGLYAQENTARLIDWKFLAKVTFKDKYYPDLEAWYVKPVFPESIQKLDGKRVIIKGYIIPLDVEGGVYALSAYPFSACFFCGGAGPESVMSLKFKETPRRFKTDDVVTLSGFLKLNDSNVDEFSYILQKAEEID